MAAKTVATIRALSADRMDFLRNLARWERGDGEIREQVKLFRKGVRENGAGGFIAEQEAAERAREEESRQADADYHGWRTQIGRSAINSAPIRLLPDGLMAVLSRKAPDPLDMPPKGTGSQRVHPKRAIAKKPRQPLRRAPEVPTAAPAPPPPPAPPPSPADSEPYGFQEMYESIFGKD